MAVLSGKTIDCPRLAAGQSSGATTAHPGSSDMGGETQYLSKVGHARVGQE